MPLRSADTIGAVVANEPPPGRGPWGIPRRPRLAHSDAARARAFGRNGRSLKRAAASPTVDTPGADASHPAALVDVRSHPAAAVAVRDVTTRRRAQDALGEREAVLRQFVDHAPAAVAMFDRDMRYLVASRRWCADYALDERGFSPEALVGRSHHDVFPDAPARWREDHRRVLAGEVLRRHDDAFERADGSIENLRPSALRPAHRPRRSRAVSRPARPRARLARGRAPRPRGVRDGGDLPRPRRLQDRQRLVRPRTGGRTVARGGSAAAAHDARLRHGRAARQRRVRRAAGGWQRRRGVRARPSGAP